MAHILFFLRRGSKEERIFEDTHVQFFFKWSGLLFFWLLFCMVVLIIVVRCPYKMSFGTTVF